jgi:RNA polymerase sigma factor, sigma-70 family
MREELARLYEHDLERIVAFILRMTNDREAARDLAQEAFAVALEKGDSFRGESSALTWLMSIARNLCLKRLSRDRERSFGDIEAIIDSRSEEPPACSEAEGRYYVEAVKEGCLVGLLQCLSLDQRCAFILFILCDLPADSVARIMGKSENSVRILGSRARAELREFLCRNCDLMGAPGRCSCDRMIGFSLSRKLVERYDPSRTVPPIVRELRRFSDEVELYRSLPESDAAIASLVAELRGGILAN